jgi:hypothetical protein
MRELDLEGFIQLDNGKWLYNNFGKYAPNLTFILDKPQELPWEKVASSNFNLPKGNLSMLRGKFFMSKKGKPVFDMSTSMKNHTLLRDDWGGAFNDYKGYNLPHDNHYFRRASSNGGGAGYDYAIVDTMWKHTVSIDDI